MEYDFKKIEQKWQERWNNDLALKTDYTNTDNKKYCLTMFSYPSGDKLHIGHWYNYGPVDSFVRFLKMNNYNVFQPQGFDSFGLPAENFAIKNGIHPKTSTESNISTMKQQLRSIGALYNWDKEVVTSREEYYKWTQWLFLKLYKNDLAFQKTATVNWDPIDQTVLANEQVLSDGTSERSGGKVIQKPLKQWFFKITKYAEELLDFDNLEWPKKTISMQKNWIGKSKGALIDFKVDNAKQKIRVFTTRPDTIFGSTYLVVAPEHSISIDICLTNDEIKKYCNAAANKSELQRTDLEKNKTGVFSGLYAINPANNNRIPIWIADYVISSYGTGAIMAVPGHDSRDFEFAKKYNLEIKQVVENKTNSTSIDDEPYTGEGININSDFLNGLNTNKSKDKIISWLEENKYGSSNINYKLKDWLISRQRYWGTPIPIVYDPDGNAHPIPEEHLPWKLPNDVEFQPKGTSPLGSSKELFERTEKIFGKGWKPEIDTMDTFVCSSWYHLRYMDATNNDRPFSKENENWLPVDHYIGGAEHATMHLLYARFVTKALRDMGYINFSEPFTHLFHQGTITKDGAKMSKSKGNTVSPDRFVEEYGSDTFRCYLMFMGPFDEGGDWNDRGITGIHRFLSRYWRLSDKIIDSESTKEDSYIIHSTIKSVTQDLSQMKFNTAISRLMEYVNYFFENGINQSSYDTLTKLLSPLAPHICEEKWSANNEESIFNEKWPNFDESLTEKSTINIAIQVNGKLRGTLEVDKDLDKDEILLLAKENNNVLSFTSNKEIIREIYVPNKLVNLVIK